MLMKGLTWQEQHMGKNPVYFRTVVHGRQVEALCMSPYYMFRLTEASQSYTWLIYRAMCNEATWIKGEIRTYVFSFVRIKKFV